MTVTTAFLGTHTLGREGFFKYPFNVKTFRLMTLSACGDDEFTCNDGSCVSLDVRCDGKEDCEDASDENSCDIIKTFEGYNKLLIPLPLESETSFILNISILISKIITIDELNGKFKVKMTLQRSWYNPQLRYLNLKRLAAKNLLSQEDKDQIWIPYTVFQNVENLEATQRTDREDIVQIIPNKDFRFERGSKLEHFQRLRK